MASRWRTWDAHFATDILDNKQPLEILNVIPVGGRGRRKFNISPSLLTIPSIAYTQLNPAQKVSGRGKKLKENQENQSTFIGSKNYVKNSSKNIEDIYEKYKKAQQDKDFPSLPSKSCSINHDRNRIINSSCNTAGKKHVTKEIKFLGCPVKNTLKSTFKDQFQDHEAHQTSDEELSKLKKMNNISEQNKSIKNIDLDLPQNDNLTNKDFLKSLSEIECYVLIENLSKNADEEEFKELIRSFGEIDVYLSQNDNVNVQNKVVLLKMKLSDNCDWVISCLHDDVYEGERLVARRVDDITGRKRISTIWEELEEDSNS